MKFLDTAKRFYSKNQHYEVLFFNPEIKLEDNHLGMPERHFKMDRHVISLKNITYSCTLDNYLKYYLNSMNIEPDNEVKKGLKNDFYNYLTSELYKLYEKNSVKILPNLNYIQNLVRRFLGIEENIFLVKDFHKFIRIKLIEYQKYSRKYSPILIMGKRAFSLLSSSKEFSFHNTEDTQVRSVNYMGNYLDKYKIFVSSYEDNYACLIAYETKENESGLCLVEGDTEMQKFAVPPTSLSQQDQEKIVVKFNYSLDEVGDFYKFHFLRIDEIESFNKIKKFILKITRNAE